MRCQRCDRLMLMERFFDFLDDTEQVEFTGWRCLICGEIVAPLIAGNPENPTWETTGRRAALAQAYSHLAGRLASIRVPLKRVAQGRQEGWAP